MLLFIEGEILDLYVRSRLIGDVGGGVGEGGGDGGSGLRGLFLGVWKEGRIGVSVRVF